jgi:PKD repeat protein
VTVNPTPKGVIDPSKIVVCQGDSFTLKGTQITGHGPLKYSWNCVSQTWCCKCCLCPGDWPRVTPTPELEIDTTKEPITEGTCTFTLTVYDANGCPSVPAEAKVTVVAKPVAKVKEKKIQVCKGDTFKLHGWLEPLTFAPAYYHWEGQGLNYTYTSQEQSPIIDTTNMAPGTYTYKLTVSNGPCSSKPEFVKVRVIGWEIKFDATKICVNQGEKVTLKWHVEGTDGVDIVTIDPQVGKVEPAGEIDVEPTAETTYVLTAVRGKCVASRSVTVQFVERIDCPLPDCPYCKKMDLAQVICPEKRPCKCDPYTGELLYCDRTPVKGLDASLSIDPPCVCLEPRGKTFSAHLIGTVSGATSWTLTASIGNSSKVIASAQNLDSNKTYNVDENYSGSFLGSMWSFIEFVLTANAPDGSTDTANVTWGLCTAGLKIISFTGDPKSSLNCVQGTQWDLEWHLLGINPRAGWKPDVSISIHCPDPPNTPDVAIGEFTGFDGSTSVTLTKSYCEDECYFLLKTHDCWGNELQAKKFITHVGLEPPPVSTPCPGDCECLTQAQAGPRGCYSGTVWTPKSQACSMQACGVDEYGLPKHCCPTEPPPPPPTACTGNCDCLTEKEAIDLGYTTLCQQEPCSAAGEPQKFCYSRCPEGCYCVTEKEADEKGYTISCSDEKCDPTSKEAKYCFSPPVQPCSQRCQCLTQAQAKEYGLSDAKRCQSVPCKQDAQGRDMYCYPKPKTPLVDVTADRSFVTQGQEVKVCWKVTGEGITEVLFSAAGEKPTSVDTQGCKTFRPTQQTRYLVTAKNAAGSGQDSVTVGVGKPPVEECPTITSFTANCQTAPTAATGVIGGPVPVTPRQGQEPVPVYQEPCPTCCSVSWSVIGPAGTTVSISGIGNVGMSGSAQAQRGASYVLTARYGNCVRTATVQVPR